MKKIYFCLATLASLMFTSLAFAADASVNSGYYSDLHPKTTLNAAKSNFAPATDIAVVNTTAGLIYAVVPNSPINDALASQANDISQNNDHIHHDTLTSDTYIILQDPYRNAFFSKNVCRLALITVYGNVGSYRVHVDDDQCKHSR